MYNFHYNMNSNVKLKKEKPFMMMNFCDFYHHSNLLTMKNEMKSSNRRKFRIELATFFIFSISLQLRYIARSDHTQKLRLQSV